MPVTAEIIVPVTRELAKALLVTLGAPQHLLRHVELVSEAAELLFKASSDNQIASDAEFVRVGVMLHDAGKILYLTELVSPGNFHEPAGEAMLLTARVSPKLARVSMSHARWALMSVSLEELVIALSDKLWKGVRVVDLEARVVEMACATSKHEYWPLFMRLDSCFEQIADSGTYRLARSQ